jgi:hypothetical protein
MNGTSDQLFARPGLTQNKHRGINRRYFGDLREYLAQHSRRTNDLFEHRRMIDFLAQRQVFFADALFGLLAFVNVGSRRIPA